MEDIGSILPSAFRKQLSCRKPPVMEVLDAVWPRVVGKLLARNCRPSVFYEGTLTLVAFSPPWAAQLSQMTEHIRDEINGFLAGTIVRKLRICCQPSLAPDARSTDPSEKETTSQPRTYSSEEVSRILWTDGRTSLDPELAEIVERSFRKYFSRNGRGRGKCL